MSDGAPRNRKKCGLGDYNTYLISIHRDGLFLSISAALFVMNFDKQQSLLCFLKNVFKESRTVCFDLATHVRWIKTQAAKHNRHALVYNTWHAGTALAFTMVRIGSWLAPMLCKKDHMTDPSHGIGPCLTKIFTLLTKCFAPGKKILLHILLTSEILSLSNQNTSADAENDNSKKRRGLQ